MLLYLLVRYFKLLCMNFHHFLEQETHLSIYTRGGGFILHIFCMHLCLCICSTVIALTLLVGYPAKKFCFSHFK